MYDGVRAPTAASAGLAMKSAKTMLASDEASDVDGSILSDGCRSAMTSGKAEYARQSRGLPSYRGFVHDPKALVKTEGQLFFLISTFETVGRSGIRWSPFLSQ